MSLIDAFNSLPEDEGTLRARKLRAERADRILKDDLFKLAIEVVRKEILDRLLACSPNDLDGLRQFRLMHDMVGMVEGALIGYIRDGSFAEDSLRRISEKKGLFGKIGLG